MSGYGGNGQHDPRTFLWFLRNHPNLVTEEGSPAEEAAYRVAAKNHKLAMEWNRHKIKARFEHLGTQASSEVPSVEVSRKAPPPTSGMPSCATALLQPPQCQPLMEGPPPPSGLPPLTCPQVPVAPPVGGQAVVTAAKAAVPPAKAALPVLLAIVQAANAATADVWDDQPVGGIAVAMGSDAAVPASETMAIAANAGVPAAKAFSAGHGPSLYMLP